MDVNRDSHIQLLSQSVVEKIAAGEVIERPASVVKELIENALDAGATHIGITIEDAGFSCIKIIDNGCGMGGDDIAKCLQRHATSKISSADDLFSISTLGFRGEALASIAAVSRVTITSSNSEEGLGSTVSSEGGTLSGVVPTQHTKGTTVLCQDLFYNVPARKKFMKSLKAERMAIMRLLEQVVISFPAVHFTCMEGGRRTLDAPQVDSPHMRIAQITGAEFAKKLILCTGETADMSVEIFISDPQDARPKPRYRNLYVNLRRVDNDSVTFAVREAFSRFIMSNLRASWFCFLEVDPSRVDVNIHPTKQRIKFDDEKALFSFIFRTVQSSIAGSIDVSDKIIHKIEENLPTLEKTKDSYFKKNNKSTGSFENAVISKDRGDSLPSKQVADTINYISSNKQQQEKLQQTSLSFLSVFEDKEFVEKEIAKQRDKNVELTHGSFNLIPCYQIHKMYILAPIKNGVVIIDQHAAHERILYEEALEDIKRGRSESQRLLFPITFDMSLTEKEVVLSCRDYFNALGFDVQDFGSKTIAVSAMPATGFMKSSDIEVAVREIVHNLIEEKDTDIMSQPEKRFAASFACGAAIKFGQELKQEEMNLLLNNLFATKNPYICPHGRPTLVRISLEELSRRFLR